MTYTLCDKAGDFYAPKDINVDMDLTGRSPIMWDSSPKIGFHATLLITSLER